MVQKLPYALIRINVFVMIAGKIFSSLRVTESFPKNNLLTAVCNTIGNVLVHGVATMMNLHGLRHGCTKSQERASTCPRLKDFTKNLDFPFTMNMASAGMIRLMVFWFFYARLHIMRSTAIGFMTWQTI